MWWTVLSKPYLRVCVCVCPGYRLRYATVRGSGEVEISLYPFIITALASGEYWSASLPGRFTLREREPGTH